MKQFIITLLLMLTLILTSCGTFVNQTGFMFNDHKTTIYGGVVIDAHMIHGFGSSIAQGEVGYIPIFLLSIIDIGPSLVGDTLLIPVTLAKQQD